MFGDRAAIWVTTAVPFVILSPIVTADGLDIDNVSLQEIEACPTSSRPSCLPEKWQRKAQPAAAAFVIN